jgi:hypothetical protein
MVIKEHGGSTEITFNCWWEGERKGTIGSAHVTGKIWIIRINTNEMFPIIVSMVAMRRFQA